MLAQQKVGVKFKKYSRKHRSQKGSNKTKCTGKHIKHDSSSFRFLNKSIV